MHANGLGTPADMRKACLWYDQAASKGELDFSDKIPLMTVPGLEMSGMTYAFKTLYDMANADDSYAQYLLGKMYLQGFRLKESPGDAFDWMLKASGHGNGLAKVELGTVSYTHLTLPTKLEE